MPSLLYRDPRVPLSVYWVPRTEWGSSVATETFIANRYSATADAKTNVQIHHTAAIDIDDQTPNQWDYDEAAAYMRRLQTSRPDLGPLPYSENLAVSEDPERVWLLEGRGLLKVGAHTAGYNISGIGWGVLANFDRPTSTEVLSAVRQTIRLRVLDLKTRFPNLGSLKNPQGWDVWGHRDTAAKSCPGNLLYPTLSQLTLEPEDDMPLTETDIAAVANAVWAKELKQWGDFIANPPAAAGLLLGQTHANAWNATKQTSRTALLSVLAEADDDDLAAIARAVADEQARRLQA